MIKVGFYILLSSVTAESRNLNSKYNYKLNINKYFHDVFLLELTDVFKDEAKNLQNKVESKVNNVENGLTNSYNDIKDKILPGKVDNVQDEYGTSSENVQDDFDTILLDGNGENKTAVLNNQEDLITELQDVLWKIYGSFSGQSCLFHEECLSVASYCNVVVMANYGSDINQLSIMEDIKGECHPRFWIWIVVAAVGILMIGLTVCCFSCCSFPQCSERFVMCLYLCHTKWI